MPISVNDIDAILPQTQCGDCGYDGCLPYATALANGEAEINLCPPGGKRGLRRLGELLKQPIDDYLADFQSKASTVAVIDESLCIGCVKCITACPVDAIVGSRKLMHTVISDQCTGCQLCVEPCPMDCISMQPIAKRDEIEQDTLANLSRQRYQARNARLERLAAEKQRQQQQAIPADPRAAIAAALARKKQA